MQHFQSLRPGRVAGTWRPQVAHRAGEHHPRVRLTGHLIALAVVAVVLAACGGAAQRGTASSSASPVSLPSPTQATATPTPPAPSTVKTPSANRTQQSDTCRASDFRLISVQSDGAMGSMYTTVSVVYRGPATCRIASTPTLRYRTAAGLLVPLPTVPEGDGPATVRLRTDRSVFFVVRTVSGYGGYDPTSPECAHPATYRQIQVRLGEGYLSLREWQLNVLCGKIWVRNWSLGTAP
jgi:Protein of unknown function (DUF4232)